MMGFSYEKRYLKRPRLGPPDVYPQEPRQKEVGFIYRLCFNVIFTIKACIAIKQVANRPNIK